MAINRNDRLETSLSTAGMIEQSVGTKRSPFVLVFTRTSRASRDSALWSSLETSLSIEVYSSSMQLACDIIEGGGRKSLTECSHLKQLQEVFPRLVLVCTVFRQVPTAVPYDTST